MRAEPETALEPVGGTDEDKMRMELGRGSPVIFFKFGLGLLHQPYILNIFHITHSLTASPTELQK